jgi:DNA polymerase (family 10)
MDNAAIADNFSLLSKLMDINGENSFKTKTYSIAAYNIENLPVQLKDTPRENLFRLKGIGDSIGNKVVEMLDTGQLSVLNEYIQQTPPGVIELLNIKGLGPKKIHTIWKQMEIESVGELLYACNENRLTLFKGFGEKTQQNVQEAIEFYLQNQGSFLYAQIDEVFPQIDTYLKKLFGADKVAVTGAYRRQDLTIDELEFVIQESNDVIKPKFQTAQPPELLEETESSIIYKLKNGLKIKLYTTGTSTLTERLFYTTGPASFTKSFQQQFSGLSLTDAASEEAIFAKANIQYIPAYLRNSADSIVKAKKNQIPDPIQTSSITSIIHSHSNWSDGVNTIEEMANECIRRGLEFLVISDHSKAATYAKGLSEERIREQHRYIDQLNEKYLQLPKPFKIFKSIECDILTDGSLDYTKDILAKFDLIIASVHSNLKMTEEKAMHRVITAINNPYVTILGHMTGRLLLSRKGYPLDHKKVIDTCAENNVVIELNAHPRRLDIDWQWIDYALQKNVLLSINPDAHSLDGFDDIKYGVLAAQKGGLSKEQNLSSFSLAAFENHLAKRKTEKQL